METLVVPQHIKDFFKEFADALEKAFKPIQELAKKIVEGLKVLGYITGSSSKYLSLSVDEYGYFVIEGKRMMRCHSKISACGRFLYALMEARSNLVEYSSIENAVGDLDRKQVFKDLKSQLRQNGYKLKYELVRTKGIAMLGLATI